MGQSCVTGVRAIAAGGAVHVGAGATPASPYSDAERVVVDAARDRLDPDRYGPLTTLSIKERILTVLVDQRVAIPVLRRDRAAYAFEIDVAVHRRREELRRGTTRCPAIPAPQRVVREARGGAPTGADAGELAVVVVR